jgi:hypothetical protein
MTTGLSYWRNVLARVWGYYIGGYQVIKKWLSYREYAYELETYLCQIQPTFYLVAHIVAQERKRG